MKKRTKKLISTVVAGSMMLSFGTAYADAENSIAEIQNPVVLKMDFEEFNTGTKLSDTGLGWSVSDSNDGDSITIETDPVSGSKAIKLTQAFYEKKESGNPTTGFEIPFDTISDGIVDISFKIRSDSWTSRLSDNGFVFANDGTNLIDFNQYQSAIYTNGLSDWMGTLSADTYKEVNFVCDFTNKSSTVSFSGKTFAKNGEISVKDISKLKFNINANYKDLSSGWIDQSSKTAPVYWIDDISVTKRSIEVSEITTNDTQYTVTFNQAPADDYINNTYFALTSDGQNVEGYEVARSETDEKQVVVTLPENFEYNKKYTLTVNSGIMSKTDGIASLYKAAVKDMIVNVPNVLSMSDFEEFVEGTKLSDTSLGWTVSDGNDGDKVTIETDKVSGSKAVRIEQTKQTAKTSGNPTTGFILDGFGDKITDGIVDISFKIRREHGGAVLPEHTFLGVDNGYRWHQCHNDIFLGNFSDYAGKITADYSTWNITYDFVNDKVKINDFLADKDMGGYSGLQFLIAANYGNGAEGWLDAEEAYNPVYWIDDISVTKRCVEVNSVKNSGREFYVDFNVEPADAYINNTYFKLLCAGQEISDITVAKSEYNAKRVIISLPEAAEYGVDYTVSVAKGINAAEPGYMQSIVKIEKNITIEAETRVISENFDEITDFSEQLSDWTIKTSDDGTSNVSVEEDTLTGSKALKIVNKKGNLNDNGVIIPFTKQSGGKIKISYKLRSENHSAFLTDFNISGTEGKRVEFLNYGNKMYLYTAGLVWSDYSFMTISDKYQKIDIIANVDYGTYSVICDGIVKYKNINMGKSGDVSSLSMIVSENDKPWTGAEGIWTNPQEGDGVYWIDDISVTSYTYPEIISSSIANGAQNVSVDSAITYTFDKEVIGVGTSSVHVYKNGVVLGADEYSVSYADKTATISINEGLVYAASYSVIFADTIVSENYEKMKDSYVFTFSTEENPNAVLSVAAVNKNGVIIEDLSEFNGETITVKVTANPTLSDYTFIAVIKDEDERVVSAALIDSTKVSDNTFELTLTVPNDATENYIIEGFIWETTTQKPLDKKLPIVKKNNNLKIYVSAAASTGGCGTKEAPFATLVEAKNYAREVKTSNVKTEIVVMEGEYKQENALVLGAADNNTLIRAYRNDTPTISGGVDLEISNFSAADDERIKSDVLANVKKINLKELGISAPTLTLRGHSMYELSETGGGTDSMVYADGEMLFPARYPNDGYLTVKNVIQNGNAENHLGMSFTADTDMSRWTEVSDAWVYGFWYYDWSDQSARVEKIEGDTITTKDPSGYGVREGQRFYIYNLLEELDSPGEWYYDGQTGDFYIYPPKDCKKITICSEKEHVIQISDAESIEIRGLKIENSGKDGINMKGNYLAVNGCEIMNTADSGIFINGTNAKIVGNTVYNNGMCGISVSGGDTTLLTSSNNRISQNIVHDNAKLVCRYSACIRIIGVGTNVEDNILYNTPHSAITFAGNDHVISGNEIYNALCESADAGAIYSGRSAISRGTEISGNYIHDLATSSVSESEIFAIYLDDCLCGVSIKDNRIENVSSSGICINGGRNNTIVGNVLKNIKKSAIVLTSAGMASWSGTDEEFINTMGLSSGIHKTTPYLKYPNLYNILEDDMRMPKYNVIKDNSFSECVKNTHIEIYQNATTEEAIREVNTVLD